MKVVLCSLIASVLLTSAGHPEEVWARPGQRVVVERFTGPGTIAFRRVVLRTLDKLGVEAVPDGAPVLLRGAVTAYRRGFVAVLVAKAPNGRLLAPPGVWMGPTVGKALLRAAKALPRKLTMVLARAPRGGGGGPVAQGRAPARKESDDPFAGLPGEGAGTKKVVAEASDERPSRTRAPSDEAEEAPRRTRARTEEARADDEPRPARSRRSDDEEPPPRRSRGRGDEEDVASSADAPERPPSAGGPALDVEVGAHVYGRFFNYNQSFAGNQDGYLLPLVPSPALSVDYYVLPWLGISAGGEVAVGLASQHPEGGAAYQTTASGYFIGGKVRYLPSSTTELMGGVAYATNSFKLVAAPDDPNPPHVPAVDYRQVRLGTTARFVLGKQLSAVGGASYLHLLGIGELRDGYFPNATGHGGEGHAGLAFPLSSVKGLEVRVTADLRRYVFSMHSLPGDAHVAGGAVDQYIGANLSFGYRR
jgi:hypothetical protein